jgi:hypothetical protein
MAQQLLSRLWENRNGCLSVQILQEFYVVTTRQIANPLSLEAAKEIIRDFRLWKTHAADANDVLAAIELQRQHQVHFRMP